MKKLLHTTASVLALLVLAGCATTDREPQAEVGAQSPALLRARSLYEEGRLSDAIVAVSEIARKDPLAPGLVQLESEIMAKLSEIRKKGTDLRSPASKNRMLDEVLEQEIMPATYRIRRNIRGDETSLRAAPTPMQEALRKNVTIHLDNVDLTALAAQIADTEGINIVADSNLGDGTITIHAQDTPLVEILDYVGRNLGVVFSVGENLIWATASEEQTSSLPLETRIFHLRKGLVGDEMVRPDGNGNGGGGGGGGGGGMGGLGGGMGGLGGLLGGRGGGQMSASATPKLGGGSSSPTIIDVLTRFVPQPEGSDIYFSDKAHLLIVKNTKENLMASEDLIEALDIVPPQVLIEARFISTSVADLSELGLDWVLDDNYVLIGGPNTGDRRLRVNQGGSLSGTAFENAIGGNFTFQGVLTDPQFRAVLHVLESSGTTRTLSVPRVTALNNRPAYIRVGEDFRYYEEYDLEDYEDTDANGNRVTRNKLVPQGTPTLEELGIELTATPSVGADLRTINLALIPEISSFVKWEYYEASSDSSSSYYRNNDDNNNDVDNDLVDGGTGLVKLPIFSRRHIETDVIVQSGETVIMGGLITSTSTKVREGVPILSRLPFVGQLFRHDTVDEDRQNLIIFVTATLISDRGEELVPLDEILTEDNAIHTGVGATPAPGLSDAETAAAEAAATEAAAAEEAPAPEAAEQQPAAEPEAAAPAAPEMP